MFLRSKCSHLCTTQITEIAKNNLTFLQTVRSCAQWLLIYPWRSCEYQLTSFLWIFDSLLNSLIALLRLHSVLLLDFLLAHSLKLRNVLLPLLSSFTVLIHSRHYIPYFRLRVVFSLLAAFYDWALALTSNVAVVNNLLKLMYLFDLVQVLLTHFSLLLIELYYHLFANLFLGTDLNHLGLWCQNLLAPRASLLKVNLLDSHRWMALLVFESKSSFWWITPIALLSLSQVSLLHQECILHLVLLIL